MTERASDAEMAFKELVLERFEIGMRGMVSRHTSVHVEIERHLAGQFAYNLRAYFLSNEIQKMVDGVEQIPVGFWDYIKARLPFKRWLRPQLRTVIRETKFVHVCPHIDFPDNDTHIRFMMPSDSYVAKWGKP